MLDHTHSIALTLASLAVALMASFTGLTLTRGISELGLDQRKRRVAMAAVALGGGIWSMHFVAMLGMHLPHRFTYDPLLTLSSALVAILVVGSALLIVHFLERTPQRVTLAGVIVGAGIPAMHYIGMAGIQPVRPIYSVTGVAVALGLSLALGVVVFRIIYSQRTRQTILIGTGLYALAVFAVHFVAMAGTRFSIPTEPDSIGPVISNYTLAMIVAVISFLICGAFLLTGITFLPTTEAPPEAPTPEAPPAASQVPFERNNQTVFVEPTAIAAVRAEGHYTLLYVGGEKLFCPWSISKAADRLEPLGFIRTHRSYLVNIPHVTSFERLKDNGVLYFDETAALAKVPVSRSRIAEVRTALGL